MYSGFDRGGYIMLNELLLQTSEPTVCSNPTEGKKA